MFLNASLEKGIDVLIIALEMSRVELTARSISRLTAENSTDQRQRKTTQGILQGERYQYYSPQEMDIINRAKAQYKQFAPHLFIFEGVGNIDAAAI